LSLFADNELEYTKTSLKDLYKFGKDVIKYTKDKNLAGVRVEARGRLTRRFKASRSVYKLK
jgi:hypothetical protein